MPNKEIDGNKGAKTAVQTECQTPDTTLSTLHSKPFVHPGLSCVSHLSMALVFTRGTNKRHLLEELLLH